MDGGGGGWVDDIPPFSGHNSSTPSSFRDLGAILCHVGNKDDICMIIGRNPGLSLQMSRLVLNVTNYRGVKANVFDL